jgi:DHA1 family bicyclomycin/chloramphenicol resistance-like MFS transporter
VQITLAAYFLGLAVGQITQGTLSDRYGRRWPLAIGMVIYTLATIGCALTPSLLGLSIMRGLSAFGGSASGVITRAIVRDLADGHAAARIMSKMMLVMGVAPIMAPTVGSLVLGVWGWQAIFWVCAAYGGICLIGVLLLLPETLPESRRTKLGFTAQISRYVQVMGERGFITNTMMGGMAMFGMFAYLAGSPSVFIRTFGLAPSSYGIMFGACASGFILASQINPRLLHRFGTQAISRVSMRVMLVATLVMTTISFAGYATWPLVAVCVLFAMSSQGFTMPNATVGALARHAAHAGSASALMGTLQFALAGVSGLLVGLLEDGTARPMAGLMFLGALGANIAEWYRPKVKA